MRNLDPLSNLLLKAFIAAALVTLGTLSLYFAGPIIGGMIATGAFAFAAQIGWSMWRATRDL